MRRWDHQNLGVFGIGADLPEADWRNVFRQLVAMGLARVDHASYGALRLTEAARPVLRGEVKVEMRRAVERKRVKAGRKRAAVAPVTETLPDQARLARLKAWRLEEARRQDVPAYVILHDATLAEIARRCPTGPDELADITGIGKVKLERYGQVLVTLANGEVPATPEE